MTIMQRRPTAVSLLLWLSCLGLSILLVPRASEASPWSPGTARLGSLAPAVPEPSEPDPETFAQPEPDLSSRPAETVCNDGQDDDGDTVLDCGDADCKADAACQPDGQPEYDDARCGDWVDNDSDGYVDCDDFDCDDSNACKGSWDLVGGPAGVTGGTGTGGATTHDGAEFGLERGQTPEDLLGKGDD